MLAHRGSIVLGALLVAVPVAPRAQTADSIALPRVVVTATRTASGHGAGVATAAVLDASALRRRGVTDLADALRTIPGLHVVRGGGPGAQVSLFMRGAESDYVRVLVDGVSVNEPGGAVDLSPWTLDALERIEVVRGPASVLYGSDAVAGVVQMFTRRAASAREASGRVSVGSYGALTRAASIGGRGRGVDIVVGAGRRSSDGLHAFNSEWWNESFNARVGVDKGGSKATLSVLQHRDEFHYPTDGSGTVVDRNAVRSARRSTLSVDAEQRVSDRVRLALTLSALEGRGRTVDDPDGPSDTVGFFAYRDRGSVRRRALDGRLQLLLTPGVLATIGAEWSTEAQRSRDSSNFGGPSAFGAERSTRAAYAQIAGGSGRAQFTVGGRYDDNSVFGGFATMRGGATVGFTEELRLRGSVGTAFKAPTFFEQFSTAFTVGNPALDPERSHAAELGLTQALPNGRGEVSVTAFRQRFRDLVQFAFRDRGPNYFNTARARADGVELESRVRMARGVQITAGATWLSTEVLDAGFDVGPGAVFARGQPLLRRPERTVTLGVVSSRWRTLTLDVVATRVGPRDDRDFTAFPPRPVVLRARTRVDAGGQYRFAKGVSVMARAENVLDASSVEVFGFLAPGRALLVGLDVHAR